MTDVYPRKFDVGMGKVGEGLKNSGSEQQQIFKINLTK